LIEAAPGRHTAYDLFCEEQHAPVSARESLRAFLESHASLAKSSLLDENLQVALTQLTK